MIKKLTLIIVGLSLIVSFGFANAYAAWNPGDPDDWYFKFKATDSTATAWDLTFHAVDDTLLESFFFDIQSNNPDAGFVSGTYDMDFYMKGFSPMGAIVDRGNGNIGNIGGWIAGAADNDFDPGESMTIAHLTFADTVELDWNCADNVFCAININGGIAEPVVLLDTSTEIRLGQTVPVPGAVWLLGSAMVSLLGIKRKMKNN